MLKRSFLFGSLAILASSVIPAQADSGFVMYAPGVIEAALKEGKTVFVDYSATWCSTCKAQERIIDALLKSNPAYGKAMTFVRVDWDEYGEQAVTTDRNIPRRSTLLVLWGDKELGRIVAGTSEAEIKALLDKGI
jgi:thioredoxin 1